MRFVDTICDTVTDSEIIGFAENCQELTPLEKRLLRVINCSDLLDPEIVEMVSGYSAKQLSDILSVGEMYVGCESDIDTWRDIADTFTDIPIESLVVAITVLLNVPSKEFMDSGLSKKEIVKDLLSVVDDLRYYGNSFYSNKDIHELRIKVNNL